MFVHSESILDPYLSLVFFHHSSIKKSSFIVSIISFFGYDTVLLIWFQKFQLNSPSFPQLIHFGSRSFAGFLLLLKYFWKVSLIIWSTYFHFLSMSQILNVSAISFYVFFFYGIKTFLTHFFFWFSFFTKIFFKNVLDYHDYWISSFDYVLVLVWWKFRSCREAFFVASNEKICIE